MKKILLWLAGLCVVATLIEAADRHIFYGNIGGNTNDPTVPLEVSGHVKFTSTNAAGTGYFIYDATNSRVLLRSHSTLTGWVEVAEWDNSFARNRMTMDAIGPVSPHPLHLWANGESKWVVGTAGPLYPETHNAVNIGSSGSPLSLVATGLFANLGMAALPVTNIHSRTGLFQGNVGIGTTAPAASLHVIGGSIIVENSGTNQLGATMFTNLTGGGFATLDASGLLQGPSTAVITQNHSAPVVFLNGLTNPVYSATQAISGGMLLVAYYQANPGSYANGISNEFSGTPSTHNMSFFVKQAGTPTVPLQLRGDGYTLIRSNLTVGKLGRTPRGMLELVNDATAPAIIFSRNVSTDFTNAIYVLVDGATASNNVMQFWLTTQTGQGGGLVARFRGDMVAEFPFKVLAQTNIAPFNLATNFLAINTRYTNDATLLGVRRSLLWVDATLTPSATDAAQISIFVDQNADGTYEENYNTIKDGALTGATASIRHFMDTLQPGAFFVVTNQSSGTATATILSSKLTGL